MLSLMESCWDLAAGLVWNARTYLFQLSNALSLWKLSVLCSIGTAPSCVHTFGETLGWSSPTRPLSHLRNCSLDVTSVRYPVVSVYLCEPLCWFHMVRIMSVRNMKVRKFSLSSSFWMRPHTCEGFSGSKKRSANGPQLIYYHLTHLVYPFEIFAQFL